MPSAEALPHDLSLLAPGVLADPYPAYRRLLAAAGLPRDPLLGVRVVPRYQDVAAALQSPDLFPSIGGTGIAPERLPEVGRRQLTSIQESMARWLTYLPPAAHRRRRALLVKAFRPALMEALRPRVAALCDELLDGHHDGELDLAARLAQPLPVLVIAELLGFAAADRERLKRWSGSILAYFEIGNSDPATTVAAMHAALAEMSDHVLDLVAARRRAPRQDLISALAGGEGGEALADDEIVASAVQLLFAGHETTRNLLANGLYTLLGQRTAWRLLLAERQWLGAAVEECLRFESPLQLTSRTARRATAVGGEPVAEGETLLLLLGAANRDPRRFVAPDVFDITRPDPGQLGFGQGPHFCLGAALSRLEGEVVFGRLLERFPHLRLGEEPPRWRPSFVFRGLDRLPVKLAGAA